MKRSLFVSILIALFTQIVPAQSKMLTIEESVTRGNNSLNPRRLEQLSWIPGTEEAVWTEQNNGKSILKKFRAGEMSPAEIISLDELNSLLPENVSRMRRFPILKWTDSENFSFLSGNSLVSFNVRIRKAELKNKLADNAENVELAPDGTAAAFTVGNNIFISSGIDKTVQVSRDVNTDIVNGESVHRNEFGINKGIFWSPKGNLIAYYRMDQTMVTDYPLIDLNERPAKLKRTKYPMAGMNSHVVTIGVYSIADGKLIWLETGEPKDQYLTNVAWTPDEKFILVAHLNRDQNHMKLIKYDAETGKQTGLLFEEKEEKYAEPQNPPVFLNKNSSRFLWLSRRDGWNHLYLYDISGKMIQQVTSGQWEVTELNGSDKNSKEVYFTATKDGVLERHLYKVNLISGNIDRLTTLPGTHNVQVSESGRYFTDTHSSLTQPRSSGIFDINGKPAGMLLTASNPLKEFNLGKTKLFPIKAKDNTELYSMVILPPDFDSTKKYPVLVYVYGGPHSQLVTDTWLGGANLWLNYMAQQGYVIFTLDNRGTSNRGKAFEQATFRHLGTREIEDQVEGVNYLKSLPYIDGSRIGVFGWSYGGFMTTSLMTRTSGVFKVGVAGGPVVDWSYYEVMYGERYMDTPQSNPDGYKETSLLNYVDRLKGKLLLIHGTVDPTVVWQHSLLFTEKAVRLGIPLDYFPYPGHEHGISGTDNLHLYRKITNYFKDNL